MKISSLIVFVLGVAALYVSPKAHHTTAVHMGVAIGIVALVALGAGALVHFAFRRRRDDQQQTTGFGRPVRPRTGR